MKFETIEHPTTQIQLQHWKNKTQNCSLKKNCSPHKIGGNKKIPRITLPPKHKPKSQKFKIFFISHSFSITDPTTKERRKKQNYLLGVNHEVAGIIVDLVAMSGSAEGSGLGEEDRVSGFASCCAISIYYNKKIIFFKFDNDPFIENWKLKLNGSWKNQIKARLED